MSSITFPAWQLICLILSIYGGFAGFVFAAWKIICNYRDKKTAEILACAQEAKNKAEENEKDVLRLRAELPLEYVRKEDWVRNQTIIEAKLDALAAKLDGGCNAR